MIGFEKHWFCKTHNRPLHEALNGDMVCQDCREEYLTTRNWVCDKHNQPLEKNVWNEMFCSFCIEEYVDGIRKHRKDECDICKKKFDNLRLFDFDVKRLELCEKCLEKMKEITHRG